MSETSLNSRKIVSHGEDKWKGVAGSKKTHKKCEKM